MSVIKRCHCKDRRNCSHPAWFLLKRKRIAAAPGQMMPWTLLWDKQKQMGRILVALEDYFPDKRLRGRGSWSEAVALHDNIFLPDVDMNGRFWLWWQQREGATPAHADLTLEDVIRKYVDEYLIPKDKYYDVSMVRWHQEILKTIGATTLAKDIDERLAIALIDFWSPSCREKSSLLTKWQRFHAIIQHAVRHRWIERMPYDRTALSDHLPKSSELRHRDRRLYPGEEDKLRGTYVTKTGRRVPCMRGWLLQCVELTLSLGLRRNTIRLLQFQDISADGTMLNIPPHKMKGRRESHKGLTPRMQRIFAERRALFQQLGHYRPDTYIFGHTSPSKPEKIGTPYPCLSFLSAAFRRACTNAGLVVAGRDALHFHDLRAESACRLYEKTKDLPLVQQFLDHRTLQMTEIYINRLMKLRQHEAAQVMAEIEQESAAASRPVHQGATIGATVLPMRPRAARKTA